MRRCVCYSYRNELPWERKRFGLQFSVSRCGHSRTRWSASRCCEIICHRAHHKARERSNAPSKFSLYCGYSETDGHTISRWRILYIIRNRFALNRNFHFRVLPGKVRRFVNREWSFPSSHSRFARSIMRATFGSASNAAALTLYRFLNRKRAWTLTYYSTMEYDMKSLRGAWSVRILDPSAFVGLQYGFDNIHNAPQ